MKPMNVLVMMEYSGRVRDAFIRQGHYAVSCDLIESESDLGEHSTLHWWEFLERWPDWDMMVAHPPCTFLTVSGNRWYYHPADKHLPVAKRRPHPNYPTRLEDRAKGLKVVETLWTQKQIKKVVIENPIGRIPTLSPKIMGKATQIVQPWWFGVPETKATCLWERGVDTLEPTDIVPLALRQHSVHEAPPGDDRWRDRSRTFEPFADAMALQWGTDYVKTGSTELLGLLS